MMELALKKKQKKVERVKSSIELESENIVSIFKEKGVYDNFLTDSKKARMQDEESKNYDFSNTNANIIKYCKLTNVEVPKAILKFANN